MSYYFTGFFASPAIERPAALPEGAIWRDIEAPFVGVGVRLPECDDAPLLSRDEVLGLLRQVGLAEAHRWIYLHYVCWGGSIDFVHGMGSRDGESFGPAEECEMGKVDAVFVALMEQFGVTLSEGTYFEPFVYGYWGERDRRASIKIDP
jgi:hypothetical protein